MACLHAASASRAAFRLTLMGARGRKSSGDVEFNVIEGGFAERPDPPDDLMPRQKEIWVAIAHDEPLECFSTAATRELLKDYCLHIHTREMLTETINEVPKSFHKSEKGLKHLSRLLRARDIETRAAASIATKLRLTNQSRYTPLSAATASRNTTKGIRPWDWEK